MANEVIDKEEVIVWLWDARRRVKRLTREMVDGDMIRLPTSKNGEQRSIPILPVVEPAHLHIPFALHPRTYYATFEEARDKAGIKNLRFHDLRHTTASLLINQGNDLYTVGTILGHKDPKTTQRYAHLRDDFLRTAMRKIA